MLATVTGSVHDSNACANACATMAVWQLVQSSLLYAVH